MTDAIWLQDLNPAQYSAVTAPLQHLLVLAGAGSGKTRVLVSRIAHLVNSGQVTLDAVLAVTFTNKAAGEMKSRLTTLLQHSLNDFWIGTFHGICHRLLRRHYETAKLPQAFQILDSDDQLRMIKRVMSDLRLDFEQWPPKQAQAFINQNKDEGLRAAQVFCPSYGPAKTWLSIYQAYEQACQTAGVIDTVQYAWVKLLAGQQGTVLVVGDDDQSIYGWRGAKVENIQRFAHDFNGTQTIRLEQNYRSTATILQAANALIAHNQVRMGKSLWTAGQQGEKIMLFAALNELEEARFVSERVNIELKRGGSLQDIAILYRSNAQSRVLEEALLRAGIAYRIHGGLRFFERAEVKDALAYLRLILNRNDDNAFERVVNLPARGIGEKTLDLVRDMARSTHESLWTAATQIIADRSLTQRAGNALAAFLTLIEMLDGEICDRSLEDQCDRVIQLSGLYAYYAAMKGDVAESKLQNLQELVSAAKEFRYAEEEELPYLVSFLAHASLEAGDLQADEHEDSLQMMTLHAAKGLEFPCVFLVGMEEGLFPAKQSNAEPGRIEEERRLCYVGMTRARQRLFLSYAEVRRQYGREEYHRPSRFLQEIPLEWVDEIRSTGRGSVQSYSPATQAQHPCGLCLGQTVQHAHFGSGVILAIEGQGAHTRAHINFAEHGSKWLVLTYANLV